MMKTFFQNAWNNIRRIFGLHSNSKYVRDYLNDANVRSGVFMSAIIFVLEVWLLIRQTDKYIIPTMTDPSNTNSLFKVVFLNTSNFWLLLSFAVTMFFACLGYKKINGNKKKLISILIPAAISLVFCALMPFEFIYSKRPIVGVPLYLLISLYASIALFNIFVIIFSIYHYRGGKKNYIPTVVTISLFALVCLSFGMKVSYGDFSSVRTIDGQLVPNPDYKQIICFLMMAMYVGCLLIWKPYVSIAIIGSIFIGFYLLLEYTVSPRKFPEGDLVNYITFLISLTMICISIYVQRVNEAEKDEELEYLATKDPLTDLMSFEYFTSTVNKVIKEDTVKKNEWVFLFVDVVGFKVINDQKGYLKGNEFLIKIGELLREIFGGYISRQADDHYALFTENIDIENKVQILNEKIKEYEPIVRPDVKFGAYTFVKKEEPSREGVEKARYAYTEARNKSLGDISFYDEKMHDQYRLNQYVVRHIDEAIESNYLKPYYQPVVASKDKKLIGAEVLVRWIDPKYGMLSPIVFVPQLENARLIHKLDIAMLRNACKHLREEIDAGKKPLALSINFSRMDFITVDIVSMIEEVVNEYQIDKDLLHIEITESALMDDQDKLKDAIDRLHKFGYKVWLDDFGSGYSSFNVLKDFSFDVLKLDMAFLSSFGSNPKAKTIIGSVVEMAKTLGIGTLCEGVETKEQADFLSSIGVERLQGYLYGKPEPYEAYTSRQK